MARLKLFLLGKVRAQQNGRGVAGLEGRKTQELLGYLVIHRARPHLREKLAELLWPDKSPAQSRRYLRQTLWQIHSTLDNGDERVEGLITVESDWLQINPEADFWSDVTQLEETAKSVRGIRGIEFTADVAHQVKAAARLYRGDLLENCYQDWCILERERLQNMYLGLLDKLMDYCQIQREYGAGVIYGTRMLRSDIARERTYRKLMSLHYLNHDRTGALRQYRRCSRALEREFGVQPAQETVALYECILNDQPLDLDVSPLTKRAPALVSEPDAAEMLKDLNQIAAEMLEAHKRLQQDMATMREALQSKR